MCWSTRYNDTIIMPLLTNLFAPRREAAADGVLHDAHL